MLKTVGFPSTRTGDQTILSGNLVIGTAGKGIDFSSDPSAPGMTSELLDDYEEGTWTPSLGGDATYTIQTGTYTKIGRQVIASCDLQINVRGTGSANTISGLPFAVSTNQGAVESYFANLALSVVSLSGSSVANQIVLVGATAAAVTKTYAINALGNNSRVNLTIIYTTN